jgi:hypothetical protein
MVSVIFASFEQLAANAPTANNSMNFFIVFGFIGVQFRKLNWEMQKLIQI